MEESDFTELLFRIDIYFTNLGDFGCNIPHSNLVVNFKLDMHRLVISHVIVRFRELSEMLFISVTLTAV